MNIKNSLRKIFVFLLLIISIFTSSSIFSSFFSFPIIFPIISKAQASLRTNSFNNNYVNNYVNNYGYNMDSAYNGLDSLEPKIFLFSGRSTKNTEVYYIERRQANIANFFLQKNIEEEQCQIIARLLKTKYNLNALLPGQKIIIKVKVLRSTNKNKKYYIDCLILELSPAEALIFKLEGENFIVNKHYRKDIKKHVAKIRKINSAPGEAGSSKKSANLLTRMKQGENNFFTRGRAVPYNNYYKYYKYIAYDKDYRVPAYLIEEAENILQNAENNKGKTISRENLELLLEVFSNNKEQIVGFGNILFISVLNNSNNINHNIRNVNFSHSKRLELYRYVDQAGKISYVDPNHKENFFKDIPKPKFAWPVSKETPISSKFGPRKDPFLGKERFHKGVDFAAPVGTPIKAASSGIISYIGNNGGYGKYIKIQHNSEYETAYAHLRAYGKSLKMGSSVLQGQTIGYLGSTGRSTGPHLHYEVIFKNKHIDPLQVYSSNYEAAANLEEIKAFNSQMAVIRGFRNSAAYIIH